MQAVIETASRFASTLEPSQIAEHPGLAHRHYVASALREDRQRTLCLCNCTALSHRKSDYVSTQEHHETTAFLSKALQVHIYGLRNSELRHHERRYLALADANQAVWEMTQLIIAPKKVFRNIYYHVCHSFNNYKSTATNIQAETFESSVFRHPSIDRLTFFTRNQKLVPPSRSSIHLPPLALLPHDRRSLGVCLRRRGGTHSPNRIRLCPRPLPRNFIVGFGSDVLSRRSRAR